MTDAEILARWQQIVEQENAPTCPGCIAVDSPAMRLIMPGLRKAYFEIMAEQWSDIK